MTEHANSTEGRLDRSYAGNLAENARFPDDEISLIDLWRIVMRRWVWVLVGFIAFVAAGVAFALFSPPVFEASAKIQIGQVRSDSGEDRASIPIVSATVASAELLQSSSDLVGSGELKSVSITAQSDVWPAILDIVAVGSTPEAARQTIEQTLARLLGAHQIAYDDAISPFLDRSNVLAERHSEVQETLREYDAGIQALRTTDPILAMLLLSEKSDLAERLAQIEAEISEVRVRLSSPMTFPSHQVGSILASDVPASPRPPLVLALSVAFGLVGGLIIALVAEFFTKARQVSAQ
ncbi:Wzz/FepE/Etk N-terminal domain-containing protein [Inquilinus sp. CAU 1745]|uniref:Wzz/FepE/Etk N-terminal domain-containing protein n=1 Tax=Inquilinus sp. CAU 1745 TaxID=3140369 RepID=UPI00325ACCCE